MSVWLKDGKLITKDGNLVECDKCPCSGCSVDIVNACIAQVVYTKKGSTVENKRSVDWHTKACTVTDGKTTISKTLSDDLNYSLPSICPKQSKTVNVNLVITWKSKSEYGVQSDDTIISAAVEDCRTDVYHSTKDDGSDFSSATYNTAHLICDESGWPVTTEANFSYSLDDAGNLVIG